MLGSQFIKTLSLVAGVTVLCGAQTASGAVVSIDTFNSTAFQVVVAPSLGNSSVNPATTFGPTTDAIGGTRRITNTRTVPSGTGNAFNNAVQTSVTTGSAFVSTLGTAQGTSHFIWATGGLNADLVDGTNTEVTLEVSETTGATLTLELDGQTVARTSNAPGTVVFPLAEFVGIDPTSVGSISLLIDVGRDANFRFDTVQAVGSGAVVPLPASAVLLLGAVGAVGVVRRKRA